jgi:hypothetical protein
MAEPPPEGRAAIESCADGSPQVAYVWAALDGDELVTAHLASEQQKLKNVARDPPRRAPRRAADTERGPGTRFPPMSNPPAGFVMHISVDRGGGYGPWSD